MNPGLLALLLAVTPPTPPQPPTPPEPPTPPVPMLGEEKDDPFAGPPSGNRFTGEFKDAPVEDVLNQLADAAGLSVVLPGDLDKEITARFRNVPVEDAFRAVLGQARLQAARQGSVLTIRKSHKFQFHMDMEDMERDGDRGERVVTGDFRLGPGESVRELVTIQGSSKLGPGSRAREVVAVLGSIELEPGALVEREAVAILGDIKVAPGARIGRGAISVGGKVQVEEGGMIGGEQVSIGLAGLGKGLAGLAGAGMGKLAFSPLVFVGNVFARFALYFALSLLLLVFAPKRIDIVAGELTRDPAQAALVGLVAFVALPLLTLLLVVTIVGIPLILLEVAAVMVATVLGFASLATLIGRRIPLKLDKAQAVAQLALGTLIVVAVSEIPVLGVLATIAAWVVVFGAVLRTRFGQNPEAPATPEPPSTTAAPPVPVPPA